MKENKKTGKRISIIVILIAFAVILIWYNIVSFHRQNVEIQLRVDRHRELEAEQHEKIALRQKTLEYIEMKKLQKSGDTEDIMKFDREYAKLMNSLESRIDVLDKKLIQETVDITGLAQLSSQRLNISEELKEKYESLKLIPEPLEKFDRFLKDFLENDIENWNNIYDYYKNPLAYSDKDLYSLKQSFEDNMKLYAQAEYERKKVYEEYGLEILLR